MKIVNCQGKRCNLSNYFLILSKFIKTGKENSEKEKTKVPPIRNDDVGFPSPKFLHTDTQCNSYSLEQNGLTDDGGRRRREHASHSGGY